jgi:hypothetical protein
MKLIISICAGALLALNVFATGVTSPNGYQVGVSTFSAASSLTQTNVFPIPYTTLPVIALSSSTTNNTPFSVSSVTVSNFILTVTTGSTTNQAVTWTSYPGSPRIQTGTVSVTAGTLSTNTFATPYAYTPTISIDSSTTNGVAVNYISPTNFVVQSFATQTVYWQAIGTAYAPGASTVTY